MNRIAQARQLYVDANLIMYFFERQDAFHDKVRDILDHAVLAGQSIVVSEIGIAECMYGAFRLQSEALEKKYREFFYDLPLINIVPVDGEKLITAAALGASKGLKLVDAVHFAAAVKTGCDVFVTNDRRFQSSHSVTVVQLSDINSQT
ncbi:MAG: type II toxin-antitoxin system VapC family toxin [Rhizobiaceae bacterium]